MPRTHSHADQKNSQADELALESVATVLNASSQGQLKSIIDRVQRLQVERDEVLEQIKEVYNEAKGNGFDVKILRKVVRILRQDRAKRQEEEAILDLYLFTVEGEEL